MVFPSVSSSLKARSSLADQPTWVAHDGDRSAGHHAGGREGLWYSGSSSSRRNRALIGRATNAAARSVIVHRSR
jgi:hypothetical protein